MKTFTIRPVAALGVLVAVLGCAACGGKDDNAKITSRVEHYVDHFNKQDAKGLINDFAPSARQGCDEGQLQTLLASAKGIQLDLKNTTVRSVSGPSATADIVVSARFADQDFGPQTQPARLMKSGDDWYIDNEGKGCTEFLTPAAGS